MRADSDSQEVLISYSRSATNPLQGLRYTFLQQFIHQMWQHTHGHLQGITLVLRSKKSRSLNFATVFTASFECNEAKESLTVLAMSEVFAAATAGMTHSLERKGREGKIKGKKKINQIMICHFTRFPALL